MLALRVLNLQNFLFGNNHYIGNGLLTKGSVMKLSFYDQCFLHAPHIWNFKLPDVFFLLGICSTSSVFK